MAFVVLNSLFLTIFVLSAAVQYNDTDALIWITVYLSAAVMCVSGFRDNPITWLPPLLLLLGIAWMAFLASEFVGAVSMAEVTASMSMQSDAVEEAREMGGLAIVCFWAACLIIRQRRSLREER
ncbi:MAG: transmembrane 220 family protein [Halioglobus sp.]